MSACAAADDAGPYARVRRPRYDGSSIRNTARRLYRIPRYARPVPRAAGDRRPLRLCAGQTSGGPTFAPGTAPAASTTAASAPAGHSHFQPLGDVIKNACPGKDIACLMQSRTKSRRRTTSASSPAAASATAASSRGRRRFTPKAEKSLRDSLAPSIRTPATRAPTISAKREAPLAPSNGQVKYQQTIWACLPSGLRGPYHIGIITQ